MTDTSFTPMGAGREPALSRDAAKLRAANVRTALVLLVIVLTFFFGAVFARHLGGTAVGMSFVGFAVFVFLLFAIGRHLRKGQ